MHVTGYAAMMDAIKMGREIDTLPLEGSNNTDIEEEKLEMAPQPSKILKYPQSAMAAALDEVKRGKPVKTAASKYGVPKTTLLYKVKGKYPVSRKMGPATVFSIEEEHLLVKWIQTMAKAGFPITKCFMNSVAQLASDLNKEFKNSKPSRKWYDSFLRRNPEITLRTSQNLTKSHSEVTALKLKNWFEEVALYLSQNSFSDVLKDPNRIFNCDESAFFLNPKGSKVLAMKGDKTVYSAIGNNEKECLTVLFCGNAAGTITPPTILFRYKRLPAEICKGIPNHWGVGFSKKELSNPEEAIPSHHLLSAVHLSHPKLTYHLLSKRTLFWPEEKKRRKRKIPSVVTSDLWQEYHRKKTNEKKRKQEELDERKKQREMKQQKKMEEMQKKATKKNKKVHRIDSDTSLSDSDMSVYSESVSDGESCECRNFQQKDYVIVEYDSEYFPGQIEGIRLLENEQEYLVSVMEGKLLDLQVTGIKTECMDHSTDVKSEMTFDKTHMPIGISFVKSEVEEETVAEIKTEGTDHSCDVKSEISRVESPVPIDFPVMKREVERYVDYSDTGSRRLGNLQMGNLTFSPYNRQASSEDKITLTKSHLSISAIPPELTHFGDEGNVLDLHMIGVKTECMDHSYDRESETTFEECPVPIHFPIIKSETEDKALNINKEQDEAKLQVTAEENEVFTEGLQTLKVDDNKVIPHIFTSSFHDFTSLHNDSVPGAGGTFILLVIYPSLVFLVELTAHFLLSAEVPPSCDSIAEDECLETREKTFKCDVCGKCFFDSLELKRHIVLHKSKRPLISDDCGKDCLQVDLLTKHACVHTGDQTCSSDFCRKKFSETIRRNGNKSFSCDVCGKIFFNSYTLKNHARVHSGEKPFCCDICRKKFLYSSSLKKHTLVHTPVEVYNSRLTSGDLSYLRGPVPRFRARLPTCVARQGAQQRSNSGPFILPLYASLGAEPGPVVMYTHVEPQWGSGRLKRPGDRLCSPGGYIAPTCYR
ncbi:hypothetical protein ANN_27555 [Periplaneta americana]|uniref:Uncharacterized protein n=1 Tax=Periplaneta americana TaxID=6978 RepID=A0ABQ8RW93_PERAM|nr:hypothetical protein ANN_27555 [Periplaneta americana]